MTLQVSATNTAAQTITPLAGSNTTQNVSFNNVITAPTAGTFDGTTFTATSAGTYLITTTVVPFAKGKRYEFTAPTRVLNLNEDASDVNFVAY